MNIDAMKMEKSTKNIIISGVLWQALEKIGNSCISFVVSIILARLLSPEEFGVVATMLIFIALSNTLVDSGFNTALIQKKDVDQIDYCSVFYLNITIALVLYILLCLSAQTISDYFKIPDLPLYLRVFSIIIIIRSFSFVQQAILQKEMMFYLSFRISFVALIISGATGIVMAYCKYGIWSLIMQQIVNAVVTAILQWFFIKWRPSLLFDWSRAKSLFRFSVKIVGSSLLTTLYNELYSVIIAKTKDPQTLAYYNRGKSYPYLGASIINRIVACVTLPFFSKIQNDHIKIKDLALRGTKATMFFVTPCLALLFVYAEPVVKLLLTDKWLPCVVFVRLCCITYLFWPIQSVHLQIIISQGRSDVFFYLELLKRVQGILVILLVYRYGVIAIVFAGAILSIIETFENAWCSKKLIGYNLKCQIRPVLFIIILSTVVSLVVYLITLKTGNDFLKILIGTIVFVFIYLSGGYFFKIIPQEFFGVLSFILKRFFPNFQETNGDKI